MKNQLSIYVVSVLLSTFTVINTQSQTLDWVKSFGSSTHNDEGYNITTDASGNVYTIGSFRGSVDFDPGAGSFIMNSNGNSFDVFIQKLDVNGNFLWAKQMGGSGIDFGYGIGVDAAGNIYTTGSFQNTVDFDPGAGIANLTSAGADDIFVQKLDANGDFVWAKRMGSSGSDYGIQLATDAAGNIYTIGYFNGTVDFDPNAGVFNLASAGSFDVFIQKLNTNGDLQWAHRFGSSLADFGYAIHLDGQGNVYTTGTFQGTVDFDPGAGTANLTSAGGEDVFILKLDNNGNHIWSRKVGGTGFDWGSSIAVDASNQVYVSGSFNASADFNPGAGTFNMTPVGSDDVFILKLDANGDFLWANQIGGSNTEYTNYLKIGASGDLYAIGQFASANVDFDPGAGNHVLSTSGSIDVFLLRLNPNGDFVWAFQMGGTGADVGYALHVDAQEYVYSTGFYSNTADFAPGNYSFTMTSNGLRDVFVHKITPCVPTGSSITVSECGSYTSPSGNHTYTSSGIYTDTLTNAGGCDSIITINLTINQHTASSLTIVTCDSHTENGQTYTSSGIFTQIIQNAAGCDSTITLDITINQSSSLSLTEIACDSYTLNGQTYTASGVYTQVLQNTAGCDSTITLDLTVNQSASSNLTEIACDNYTLNGQTYTSTGVYTQVIQTTAGCDSTITLDLTINESSTHLITATECFSYTLNGQTYTSTGVYTQVLQNTAGCDSTITLDLTINTIDLNVTVVNETLTANQPSATYQWIDCNTNTAIGGETGQSFTATANGSYGVIIDFNGCTDTTACFDITTIGLYRPVSSMSYHLFPNPTQQILNLQSNVSLINGRIAVVNTMGQVLIHEENQNGNAFRLDVSALAPGIYFVEIGGEESLVRLRWVKN